jgi:hypothetical protein
MQRKPLVAAILVSVVGAVLTGLAPSALASDAGSDDAPVNRGWEAGAQNRGWDHDEVESHTSDD